MGSKKKITILVATLSLVLVAAITTMIIVLVNAAQNATSSVNIKYTASDVYVRLSATAHMGENDYEFETSQGQSYLELSPRNPNGVLSQPNVTDGITMDKDNNMVIFEYVFENMTKDINCKIRLTSWPGKEANVGVCENISLRYYGSDSPVADFSQNSGSTTCEDQLLSAYNEGGEGTDFRSTRYVYIVARIDDILYDASLDGDFVFALSKPESSEIVTYNFNISQSNYVERESTGFSDTGVTSITQTALSGQTVTVDDINIYPAKANAAFIGWATTANSSTPIQSGYRLDNNTTSTVIASNLSSSTTLYPVFIAGTVPTSQYIYENGAYTISKATYSGTPTNKHFVIPDMYNNGVSGQGLAKVVKIQSGSRSLSYLEGDVAGTTYGLLYGNDNVETLTLGRYLTQLGGYSFYDTSNIATINLRSKNLTIPHSSGYHYAFAGTNLHNKTITLNIEKSVQVIPEYMFYTGTASSNFTIGTINFEKGSQCTTIGLSAFAHQTTLTAVNNMPSTITSISDYAFRNCSSLTTITLPETLTNIGKYAFIGCSSLMNVTIPNSVTTIGTCAFKDCTSLGDIVIPSSVSSIGNYAFAGCTSLATVQNNASIINMSTGMFDGCTLLSIANIPSSVKTIGVYAFRNCARLSEIEFPSSVEVIGESAFVGCARLGLATFATSGSWRSNGTQLTTSNANNNATRLSSDEYCWVKSSSATAGESESNPIQVSTASALKSSITNVTNGKTVYVKLTNTSAMNIKGQSILINSGSVVIDLNGKQIYLGNAGTDCIKLQDGAKLTINDSSTGGRIYGDTLDGSNSLIDPRFESELVVNNGTIESVIPNADAQNNNWCLTALYGAKIIVNGGLIKGDYCAVGGSGAINRGDTEIIINGGKLQSTCDYAIYHPQADSVLTINGSDTEIHGAKGAIAQKKGLIIINGGKFSTENLEIPPYGDHTGTTQLTSELINVEDYYGSSTMLINGGDFIGNIYLMDNNKFVFNEGKIEISGGTFHYDPAPATSMIASGYKLQGYNNSGSPVSSNAVYYKVIPA